MQFNWLHVLRISNYFAENETVKDPQGKAAEAKQGAMLPPPPPVTKSKAKWQVGYYFIVTARKRSLGQGNIFRSVCQEFCQQGGEYLTRYTPPEQTPPSEQTPPGRRHPLEQTPPQHQVHPPRPGTPPQTRYTPPEQTHPRPPPRDQVSPPGPGTPPGR